MFARAFVGTKNNVASPRGKATDFDSVYRRFESVRHNNTEGGVREWRRQKTTRQYDNQVLHTNFSRFAEVTQRLRFTRSSVTRHPPQVLRLLRVLKLEGLCLEPTMDLALQNPSREVIIIWMNSSFSIIYILFFIT